MKSIDTKLEEENLVTWFCPQINAKCEKGCICYVEASIKKDKPDGEQYISPAYCLHVLHQEQIDVYADVRL